MLGACAPQIYDLYLARSSALTTEALRRIGELCAIEEVICRKPPDERLTGRQARTKPPTQRPEALAASDTHYALAQIRYGGGDPVRTQAVAGFDPICRRWPHRDRYLRRRTGTARRCAGPAQLPICRGATAANSLRRCTV